MCDATCQQNVDAEVQGDLAIPATIKVCKNDGTCATCPTPPTPPPTIPPPTFEVKVLLPENPEWDDRYILTFEGPMDYNEDFCEDNNAEEKGFGPNFKRIFFLAKLQFTTTEKHFLKRRATTK